MRLDPTTRFMRWTACIVTCVCVLSPIAARFVAPLLAAARTPQASAAISAQTSAGLPLSTADHLAETGWWPTRATAPRQDYAGSNACRECHVAESLTQPNTPMGQAASRVAGTLPHTDALPAEFHSGAYVYRILAENSLIRLDAAPSTPPNAPPESGAITWVIGANVHGATYLLDRDKKFYESQVSSFAAHGLDLTPGHAPVHQGDREHALGLPLTIGETVHCTSCHTTAFSTDAGFDLDRAEPGIQCEACHGPGRQHIAAARAGEADTARHAIFEPADLKPAASIDLCGACHRTSMDVLVEEGSFAQGNVRFQPYRLEKSRCWEATEDARLTCTTCHNPHEPLVRKAGFYDEKCLSCHAVESNDSLTATHTRLSAKACPKATANCTSCHMPRYEVPEMHAKFTDHYIRVVRTGEVYPK